MNTTLTGQEIEAQTLALPSIKFGCLRVAGGRVYVDHLQRLLRVKATTRTTDEETGDVQDQDDADYDLEIRLCKEGVLVNDARLGWMLARI